MTSPSMPSFIDEGYLEAMAAMSAPAKRRSYELLHLRWGASVLDLGCGPGLDVAALAGLVGAGGRVVGVDHDAHLLARARERTLNTRADVSFVQAEGHALPFADGSFDAVRAERVLMHNADPVPILAEMVRVTRPGGWITAMDTDQTLGVDIEDAEMRSLRRRMMASALQHEPVFRGQPGRQLYRQFLRQGLDDVTAEAVPVYFTDFAVFRRTWLGTPSEEDFAGGSSPVRSGRPTSGTSRLWSVRGCGSGTS